MGNRTITRADLSEAVSRRAGLSRAEAAAHVESILAEICSCIARGESVKLSGFGAFIVRDQGARLGRNPKTGIAVPIAPRQAMVFKPSNMLKARINRVDRQTT